MIEIKTKLLPVKVLKQIGVNRVWRFFVKLLHCIWHHCDHSNCILTRTSLQLFFFYIFLCRTSTGPPSLPFFLVKLQVFIIPLSHPLLPKWGMGGWGGGGGSTFPCMQKAEVLNRRFKLTFYGYHCPFIYLHSTQNCWLNRSVDDNFHFVRFVFLIEGERHSVLRHFDHVKTVLPPFFSQICSQIPLARGSRHVRFRGDEPVLHIKTKNWLVTDLYWIWLVNQFGLKQQSLVHTSDITT